MEFKYQVSEDIILYAFRYCLGRQTYAVSDYVHEVIYLVDKFHPNTKRLMIKEINEAIEKNHIGAEIDKAEWLRFKAMLEKSDE